MSVVITSVLEKRVLLQIVWAIVHRIVKIN